MLTNDNQRKGEYEQYIHDMRRDDFFNAKSDKDMNGIITDFNKLTLRTQNNQRDIIKNGMGKMCKTDLEVVNLELYADKVWNLNDREQMQYRDEFINKSITPGIYPLTLEQGNRPQSELQKDVLYNFNLLKRNLENIMSSPKDIELIANSINIDNRYNINKDWDNIKIKYVNTYGVNNPHLTNKDIIKFLNENIGYIKSDSGDILLKIEDINNKINKLNANDEKRKLIKKLNIIKRDIGDSEQITQKHAEEISNLETLVNNLIEENKKYIQYIEKIENELDNTSKHIDDLKDAKNRGDEKYNRYALGVEQELRELADVIENLKKELSKSKDDNNEDKKALNQMIEKHTQLLLEFDELSKKNESESEKKSLIEWIDKHYTMAELRLIYENDPDIPKTKKEFLDDLSQDIEELRDLKSNYAEFLKSEYPEKIQGKKMSGKGLRHHFIVKLGDIGIDKDKLYNDNVLAIFNHQNKKIHLMKNRKISDDFCDLLCHILDGHTVTDKQLRILNNDERNLFNVILKMSKQHKKIGNGINIDDTINELKRQFELLEGEISAGNDNLKLFNDMQNLLGQMIRVKAISQHSATSYLKNIKDRFV